MRLRRIAIGFGDKLAMRWAWALVLVGSARCYGVSYAADTIRIAAWNMNNLHYEIGVPLREGAPARSVEDYAILRKYAERLGADIIALQEVNGPKAAAVVFPESDYTFHFSGRYVEDVEALSESDRIYEGFAVRRGIFDAITKRDVPELGVRHTDGRPVRWGTELLVERGNQRIVLMSVHLKSGCAEGTLQNPNKPNCITLAKQRIPLNAWIDDHTEKKVPFVILGDFNRAFDKFGVQDHLWAAMDDGDPPGLKLWRLPFGHDSVCWKDTENWHKYPIDFFVFDEQAKTMMNESSFSTINYDAQDQDLQKKLPSDHCPIRVEVMF